MLEPEPTLPQEVDGVADFQVNDNAPETRLSQYVDAYNDWSDRHPYRATAVESLAMVAVKGAILTAGKSVGLNLGNGHTASHIEFAKRHPAIAATCVLAAAPLAEELGWRSLAPKLLRRKLKVEESEDRSAMHHLLALSFAVAHVGNPLTEKGRNNLAIPVTPLVGGEYYSYLARKRGLGHAILAHAMNNALSIAIDTLV
jgi:membrane protease YdiL (CAAX protease family)